MRLFGTVYFKEHATGFDTPPPATHFSKFINSTSTTIQKHITWLDIWQNIWDRLSCESDMIPSVDALWRHWKRACWVMDMWHQAEVNVLEVKPIIDYGWMRQPHHWMGQQWQHSSNSATNTANVPTIANVPLDAWLLVVAEKEGPTMFNRMFMHKLHQHNWIIPTCSTDRNIADGGDINQHWWGLRRLRNW